MVRVLENGPSDLGCTTEGVKMWENCYSYFPCEITSIGLLEPMKLIWNGFPVNSESFHPVLASLLRKKRVICCPDMLINMTDFSDFSTFT